MMLKNVFICYRRDDADGYAGRFYDRLNSRFPGRVFMDVTGIGPGADFTRVIQDRVGTCHALIAVIGNEWLSCADAAKQPRLFHENDYVRHEIATALARNISVIPVLVRGAKMPTVEALPPDLAQLSFRNAIEVSDPDFDHDVGRLIEGLEYLFGEQRPVTAPRSKGGGKNCLLIALGLVLGGIGLFLLLLVMGALIQSCESKPGPAPVSSPSPAPEPSPTVREAFDFKPIGRWIYQIGDSRERPINLNDNHSYEAATEEYANRQGSWQYSSTDGKLTLSDFSDEGDADITIERNSGNEFFGQIVIEGVTHDFSIRPR